jgi:hypothetical protein
MKLEILKSIPQLFQQLLDFGEEYPLPDGRFHGSLPEESTLD